MKQAFTLIFLFIFGLGLTAQISVTPDTFEKTIKETEKAIFPMTVTNTETAPLTVYWKLIKSDDWPAEWQTQVCDGVLCYGFNTDANPANKPNNMEGMASSNIWSLKVDPVKVKGSGKIHMEFYSDSDGENKIGTTEFEAKFVADSDLVSSTSDRDFSSNLTIYPNPAQNYFQIKNDNDLASISVVNILGKEVWTKKHSHSASYDVSDLYKGMYLVRMFDVNGKLVKTIRLNKTSI